MKYKGIELEGLDKKVKLSHSRFMETDEGTDWIDKLLTCDKAALTPTQFHEVSALSSVINMDYQICNGGISQYVCNGYHEYRAPYGDDDVAQLDKHEQYTMLCKLADLLACAFGEGGKAARIIRASLEQHGLTLERARARYGKRRVSEARKWAETVVFFATGCSFLDIAEVVDRSVAQVSKEIYDTWCKDYYIGCVDNICKLAFDGYLVREQGLDEDGVEPGEVIVLEEYMDGETQELRSLGTSDVHGV